MELNNESLWQQASSFAARKHQHHSRKDGITPYIAHPVRVCLTVRQVFQCDDAVCLAAALLHDTIEDTTTDYDEIAKDFGKEVADTVAALTKTASLPEEVREKTYDEGLSRSTWKARLVKLADVYDNLTDSSDRFGASPKKAAEKARRAIVLAKGDAVQHAETKRAIDAVEALIKRCEQKAS